MTDGIERKPGGETPLESWKEVAAHLQRDVRTVIRWEKKEGLPIHRHHHLSRSSVYAYPSELDAWRANRRPLLPARRYTWRRPAPAFACSTVIALSLVMAGSGPRGGSLLQAADGIVTRQVWRDTAPRLVKRDTGVIRPLGFARGGSFYYRVHDVGANVYTAALDSMTPSLLVQRYLGANHRPVWSPDGKRILYISDRPPGRTLVIRRLETGEEQEYSPSLPIIINPQWSPDGKSVLLNGADAQRRRAGWYLFDIEKRQLTPALLGKGALVSAPLSADGAAVYYIEPRDENAKRPARIMRRDLRTGQDKEVRVLPGDVRWGEQVHASPDGRWLALLETSARGDWWNFAVLPLGGGEIRELPGPWTDVKPWKITWAPDSQQLVFVRPAMGGGKQIRSEFWGVPVDGGEQRRLGFSVPKNVMNLSVHPDGKQLAFTTREEVTEIWAMENFLPASRETSFR